MIFGETIRLEENFMKPRLNFMIGLSKVAKTLLSRN